MDQDQKKAFLAYLYEYITENKRNHFARVADSRTRYITVVLEDIFQPHNASAVLRSCDVFGIQDVHIIENKNKYRVNPDVALGASKWLSLHKYNETGFNTPGCIGRLKEAGYRIVATTPHRDDVSINELKLEEGKLALVFGKEDDGLSGEALELADEYVCIPQYGFTESLNISVSAAIMLFQLTGRLRSSAISWGLSEEEKLDLKIGWARKVVKKADSLERLFRNKFGSIS